MVEESAELLDLALELVYSAGLPDLTAALEAAADLIGDLDGYGEEWDSQAAA